MKNETNKGWVRLFRTILEWEWWDDRNTRDLFIYCILKANYDTKVWHGITVEKGSFVTSIENLANSVGLTIQQTTTAIKHLKSTNEIMTKSTNKYTTITICNYERYQSYEDAEQQTNQQTKQQTTNEQLINDQQTTNEQPMTDNNINNINNKNNINNITSHNIFVCPSILEIEEYCRERNNGVDAETFFNFYESKGWKIGKEKMKDWKAAVRTWERKNKEKEKEKWLTPEQATVLASFKRHYQEKTGVGYIDAKGDRENVAELAKTLFSLAQANGIVADEANCKQMFDVLYTRSDEFERSRWSLGYVARNFNTLYNHAKTGSNSTSATNPQGDTRLARNNPEFMAKLFGGGYASQEQ